MRSLKDWYVQIDSIKTTSAIYGKYIISKQRHPGQNIEVISDSKSTVLLDIDILKYNDLLETKTNYIDVWDRKREVLYSRKRKSVKKNGYEFMISLPPILKDIDKIDFKDLYQEVMKEYFKWYEVEFDKELNYQKLDIDTLVSRIFCVKHKNNHIHMIVPTIDINSLSFLDHSFKSCAYQTKQLVNSYLIKKHNISKENYLIEENKSQQKKSFKASRAAKKDIELLNSREELLKLLELIRVYYNQIKHTIDQQVISKVDKYFLTAKQQIENNNTKRTQKTIQKIQKLFPK